MIDLRAQLSDALGEGYRIVRELSGAGMSRVFLAEELALDREVVVKVLAPELVASDHVDRFRKEILQTARLQHPSIVPLLSVGTLRYPTGAVCPYYIMPYIRGETLRSRLEREGAFPASAALRVLRDVLEALVHAHLHGVVHRDIKPENIFIAGGHAVVTDFGIAKAVSRSGDTGAGTLPGVVIGTPVYMAPEQALGESSVDHRSDIYAVGVVAYELLAGTPPFAGLRTQQVILAHARANPEPLSHLRPDLPPQLVAAIMRCLAKEPGDRWQTADEMLRTLENVRASDPNVTLAKPTAIPAARRRMRAGVMIGSVVTVVLIGAAVARTRRTPVPDAVPMTDAVVVLEPEVSSRDSLLLSSPAAEVQSDLIHHLHNRGVVVLDRWAAEGLREQDPRSIAVRLGARYVLKPSLRRSGDVIRLTVNLDDSRSTQVIWSDNSTIPDSSRYQQDLEKAYIRIADSVASHVPRTGLVRSPTDEHERERSPVMAALLDSAQRAIRRRTRAGLLEGIHLLGEALTKDAGDAGVHAELSSAYALLTAYMYRSDLDLYEAAARSLAHANRALELDPELAEAYAARAYILFQANAGTDSVRADFRRAQRLDPTIQPGWYSIVLMRIGLGDSALAEAMRGVALDPLSPGRQINLAWDALGLHKEALSVKAAQSALTIDPGLTFARGLLGRSLLAGGQPSKCSGADIDPYLGTRAACYELQGQHDRAAVMVDSLLMRFARAESDTVYAGVLYAQELALYFASRGEPQSALLWVREAFRQAPNGIPWPVLRSRVFDRLRGTPSFSDEVARIEGQTYPRVAARASQYLVTIPSR